MGADFSVRVFSTQVTKHSAIAAYEAYIALHGNMLGNLDVKEVDFGVVCSSRTSWFQCVVLSVARDRYSISVRSHDAAHTALAAGPLRECGSESPGLMLSVTTGPIQVTITNDGVGWLPAFYGVSPEGDLVLSTTLAHFPMHGIPLEMDEVSLWDYLVYKHPLAPKTLVKNVVRLLPGSRLDWTPRLPVAVDSKSLFEPKYDEQFTSSAEAVDHFRSSWVLACRDVAAQAGDRAVIGLSGGFDSRAIANGMWNLGCRMSTLTYEFDRAELRIAKRVASRLGYNHMPVALDEQSSTDLVDTLLDLDGSHSIFETYSAWHVRAYAGRFNALVEGISADVFFGHVDYANPDRTSSLCERIRTRYSGQVQRLLANVPADKQKACAEQLGHNLSSSVTALRGYQEFESGLIWNILQRQLQWGACHQKFMWGRGLSYFNPFFSRWFLDFVARVPAGLRQYGLIYRDIYTGVFARTADIPHSGYRIAPAHFNGGFYESPRLSFLVKATIAGSGMGDAPRRFMEIASLISQRAAIRLRMPIRHLSPGSLFVWSPVFRRRFLELFDESVPHLQRWLDNKSLRQALDGLRNGLGNRDIEYYGKVTTLGQWSRAYTSLNTALPVISK